MQLAKDCVQPKGLRLGVAGARVIFINRRADEVRKEIEDAG